MKITIDGMAYGGAGVGRIDGKACFVDYAVPGDILDVEIYKEAKSYSFAKITDIITPSPRRVEPECAVFGICGGCSYLNVDYDYEVEQKTEILKDLLQRISGIDSETMPEVETVTSHRFGYRSHSMLQKSGNVLGFFQKGTNKIVPLPEQGCRILADSVNRGIKSLDPKAPGSEVRIMRNYRDEFIHADSDSSITVDEKVDGVFYKRSINGFFQANMFLRESMLGIVKEYSDLEEDDQFIDIGCGCGFFTLHLASSCAGGFGFDIDKTSLEYAKKNALRNNVKNIQFHRLSAADILPHRISPKTVVVDPPRAGIPTKGRKTINAINPDVIVYISCNPSTYARDIKDFLKNGYKLDKITLIDMFPGTHHMEIISKLKKS